MINHSGLAADIWLSLRYPVKSTGNQKQLVKMLRVLRGQAYISSLCAATEMPCLLVIPRGQSDIA